MAHSIEIWRIFLMRDGLPISALAGEAELPPPEGDETVIELARQYPGLSREVAEYLAR